MTAVDILLAGFSIVLGVIAIILSVQLYGVSEGGTRALRESTSRIEGAVSRLEALLQTLHADVFSLVKQAMGDFSAHAWKDGPPTGPTVPTPKVAEERTEARTDARIEELRQEMLERLSSALRGIRAAPETGKELTEVVETAIDRTRGLEAEGRAETFFEAITDLYRRLVNDGRAVTAGVVTAALVPRFGAQAVADGLLELRRAGVVTWSGDLGPASRLVMS